MACVNHQSVAKGIPVHRTPRFNRLALALAAGAFLPYSMATAAPVVTVAADSAATANAIAGTTTLYNNAGYAGSGTSIVNAVGDGQGSGWASTGGAYAVRAAASGKATGQSHAQFKYLLTNDSGVAQNFTMSFHIYGGSIGTSVNSAFIAGETVQSDYLATVTVGGLTKFSSQASISRGVGGIAFNSSGTALSMDSTADGVYSWSNQYQNIDLGLLAAGATLEIYSDVSTGATANVGTYTTGNCGYPTNASLAAGNSFSSGGDSFSFGGFNCFKGSGNAFYGDPTTIGGTPTGGIPSFFSGSSAVPEPGSLALVGLGLLGASLMRKRKMAG